MNPHCRFLLANQLSVLTQSRASASLLCRLLFVTRPSFYLARDAALVRSE